MLNIDDRLIKEVSPSIGPNALSVLLAIAIHLNQKTNRAFPSHFRLMELTGMGKNAVYDALKVLKEQGLLKSEQIIDSKSKKFGRRVFRISTRFIKIFVAAEDVEPLPENREPENREPENREPENRETYHINKDEQINKVEQINKEEHQAGDDEKYIDFTSIRKYDPVDADSELDQMLTDTLCGERFFRQCRIPIEHFQRYIEDFRLKVKSEELTYSNRPGIRSHFYNWATKNFEREQKDQKNGTLKFRSKETIDEGFDFARRIREERESGRF